VSASVLAGVQPVYRRTRGNPEPLAVFRALYGEERYGFLYESLEERGTRGRFSFAGGRPRVVFRSKRNRIEVRTADSVQRLDGDPLATLRELVRAGRDALPVATFPGGAVGYLGYDLVRHMAPVPDGNPDELGLPDAYFVFPEEIVIFDHLDKVVHVLQYGDDPDRVDEIEAVVARLDGSETPAAPTPAGAVDPSVKLRSNMEPEAFMERVERAKRYIRAGDIYQVVLSQRFDFPLRDSALDIYAALRRTNPSPYMYYLNLDGLEVSGSSPEMLVKVTGRRVVTRPLAGTRPRGADPDEDRALGDELRNDPKELAEHVMLLDLARNDLGRVCRVGSIRVDEYLQLERYARVMHLVSNVTGRLRDDRDAFDLFRASFPAGTVSGAPKVRAMQIIDELEPSHRGPYAGAIGYFSFLGDMDLCIAIRTLVVHDGRGYLQVGAGVVADSVPEREYQ
jgi:anthranilate synthase component 1